jgi:hypothetical protein
MTPAERDIINYLDYLDREKELAGMKGFRNDILKAILEEKYNFGRCILILTRTIDWKLTEN